MANKIIADLDPQISYDANGELAIQLQGDPEVKKINASTLAPRVESRPTKVDFSAPASDYLVISNTDVEYKISVSSLLTNYIVSDLYLVDIYDGGIKYASVGLQKIGQNVTGFVIWRTSGGLSKTDVTGDDSGGSVINIPTELRVLEVASSLDGVSSNEENGSVMRLIKNGSNYNFQFSYNNVGTNINSPISYIAQNTDIYKV